MTPRLKSSKKWTAFPKEYTEQIQGVFKENFAAYVDKDSEIVIEGRIYPEEILLRVGYREAGRLAQANFETSISYSQENNDALEMIHNCVDAAASMMMEYFETDGETDFPYVWKEVPFKKSKIYLRYSTENSELEAEANKLLGITTEDIYNEEDLSDEDALSLAEQSEELSPPRDDDDYLEEDDVDDDDDSDDDDSDGKIH